MKNILTALSIFTLTACSGSSSDSNDDTQAVAATMPTGIWKGTATLSDNSQMEVFALLAKDGSLSMETDDEAIQVGTLSLSGDKLTGSITEFEDGMVNAIDFSGSFTDVLLTASLSVSGNNLGSLEFNLLDETQNGASYSDIQGAYQDEANHLNWTLDSNGKLTGTDDDNCQYSGALSIPDADINVYSVTVTLSNCDYAEDNGTATGLATYAKRFDNSTEKSLVLILNDDARATSFFMSKQ